VGISALAVAKDHEGGERGEGGKGGKGGKGDNGTYRFFLEKAALIKENAALAAKMSIGHISRLCSALRNQSVVDARRVGLESHVGEVLRGAVSHDFNNALARSLCFALRSNRTGLS
jgi:hypothetical protein